jgi:hypothetical protein
MWSIEKSSDIGNGTRDLPAYSIVPQPNTLLRVSFSPSHLHSTQRIDCKLTEGVITLYEPLRHLEERSEFISMVRSRAKC